MKGKKLNQRKKEEYNNGTWKALIHVVCYTAIFSVVTQRSSWGGALRDDTKNGCVADYEDFLLSMMIHAALIDLNW